VISDATSLAPASAALSVGLNSRTIDEVGRGLGQFRAAVRGAVPSYCGLSATLVFDGYPVTMTSPVPLGGGSRDAGAVTSLHLPLSAVTVAATGELVLFASTPGAFVDVAADLAYATDTDTDAGVCALDAHLAPSAGGVPNGVAGFSIFNRAVGALIHRGWTPEQARARITRSATDTGGDLTTAAPAFWPT
jgi:hypothetical protein